MKTALLVVLAAAAAVVLLAKVSATHRREQREKSERIRKRTREAERELALPALKRELSKLSKTES